MTIEEKAKAYDEALERARKQKYDYQKEFDKTDKNSQLAGILRAGISAIELAFPELTENEDEKIRKWIIGEIKTTYDFESPSLNPMVEKALAYLEKQKEHSMSAEEVLARAGLKPYKDGNQWCILAGDNIQEGICGFGDTIDEALYQFLIEVLEKQKEQRPTDNEEKFESIDNAFRRGREVGFREGAESVKPAEWSEEDEKMLNRIIWHLKMVFKQPDMQQHWLL